MQPHRSETFKLSSDPFFVEKVRDIVGLYLAPPDRALVLCVDDLSKEARVSIGFNIVLKWSDAYLPDQG